MKTKIFCLLLGGLLMGFQSSFASLSEKGPIETKIWKAYYAKNLPDAQSNLKKFIELQYEVEDSSPLVPEFLQVMVRFGMLPIHTTKAEYDRKILPNLTKVFEDIREVSSLSFDPVALAKAELEWWVARRDPKRLEPENVAKLMTKTYALLYGGQASSYMKPAYLRAFAARYRDICQDLLAKDWQLIEVILTAAYECLENNLQSKPST